MMDKYGTALGIFVCGILTYIFATLWLRTISQYANDDYDHNRSQFSRFVIIIGNLYQRIICFLPFSKLTLNIRKKLQYIKLWIIVKLRNKLSDAEMYPRKSRHCGTFPCLELELKTVTEQILNTYVKPWYYKFTYNTDFIRDMSNALEDAFCNVGNIASVIDKKKVMCHSAEVYLRFIYNLIDAMEKVNCDVKNSYEKCLKMKKEITDNFQMEHWAMKDEVTEWCFLQGFTGICASAFGPAELSNSLLLKNVVTEVLAQNLVCPLIDLISDPDMLNMWLLKFMKGYAKENSYMSCYHFIADAETVLSELSESADVELQSSSTPIISVTEHFEPLDGSESVEQDLSLKLDESSPLFSVNVSEASSIESFSDENDTCKISLNVHQVSHKDGAFSGNVNADQPTAPFLAFPPILGKSRSDINISGTEFEENSVRKQNESLMAEVYNIKRSKSADCIREMQNVSALLPLNIKNHCIKILGKNNKTFVKLRSHLNFPKDIETAQEAIETEVPRLFTDIKIINTELQEKPGHSPYTLYCIQYSGVFHNVASASNVPDLVRQVVNVKRRFREFLALQSSLENCPDTKSSLKGIRGPSKWLTSPFANLDKKNIAERRAFLQNYLQELSNRDVIANSCVFQEFLAYGGDASLAFVKRSPDMNVPRIDKMFYRGMKGAIDLFKIALPNSPLEAVPFNEMDPEVFESYRDEESSAEYKFKEYLIAFTKNDPEVVDGITKYFKMFELDSSSENACDEDTFQWDESSPTSSSKAVPKRQSIHRPSLIDQPVDIYEKNSLSVENLLTDILVDVGFALLRSFPRIFKTDRLVFFVKCFLGSYINRFIDQKIAEFWNKESCAIILHTVHKAVWPETNSPKKKVKDTVDQAKLLNAAVRKIIQADYGVWSSLLLSTNLFASDALDLVLASFQNKKLNRCLIFHMLDVVAHFLCSEEIKNTTPDSVSEK